MSQVILTSNEELRNLIKEELLNGCLPELINSVIAPYFNKEEPKPPIYLSRNEVAKIFKITLPTLKKHTESGLIKAHYIGRRILYDQNELNSAFENVNKVIYRNKTRTGRAA